MHLPASVRAAGRSEEGATLVETLVAVVILGIAATSVSTSVAPLSDRPSEWPTLREGADRCIRCPPG